MPPTAGPSVGVVKDEHSVFLKHARVKRAGAVASRQLLRDGKHGVQRGAAAAHRYDMTNKMTAQQGAEGTAVAPTAPSPATPLQHPGSVVHWRAQPKT